MITECVCVWEGRERDGNIASQSLRHWGGNWVYIRPGELERGWGRGWLCLGWRKAGVGVKEGGREGRSSEWDRKGWRDRSSNGRGGEK